MRGAVSRLISRLAPFFAPDPSRKLGRAQAAALGLDRSLPALRVCVGIVTYNNPPAQLRRAVISTQLAACRAGCALSVLVLDNGGPSSDAVRDMVETVAPVGNVGFGAGQNRLMARGFADGADVFVALNPDSAMHPNCLAALLRMHLAAEGRALIEALQFPDESSKPHDPVTFNTPWASGACILQSRSLYEATGGFDERFFLYCEDVDLSWRARAAGFAVKTCVPALLFHPLGDRVPDQQTHRVFLPSCLLLGLKWGDADFAASVRADMQALGVDIPDMAGVAPIDAPPGIADFAHRYGFAPSRW